MEERWMDLASDINYMRDNNCMNKKWNKNITWLQTRKENVQHER